MQAKTPQPQPTPCKGLPSSQITKTPTRHNASQNRIACRKFCALKNPNPTRCKPQHRAPLKPKSQETMPATPHSATSVLPRRSSSFQKKNVHFQGRRVPRATTDNRTRAPNKKAPPPVPNKAPPHALPFPSPAAWCCRQRPSESAAAGASAGEAQATGPGQSFYGTI